MEGVALVRSVILLEQLTTVVMVALVLLRSFQVFLLLTQAVVAAVLQARQLEVLAEQVVVAMEETAHQMPLLLELPILGVAVAAVAGSLLILSVQQAVQVS